MDSIETLDAVAPRERLASEPLPRGELVRRSLLSFTFGIVLPILLMLAAGLGLLAIATGS